MTDPFDTLTGTDERVAPRPEFAAQLRDRIARLLDIPPTIDLARRIPMSSTTTRPTATATTATTTATGVTPYLAVHDGPAALDFYAAAFGAIETMRVAMDNGRIGHAEFHIGDARFYLSDEFPEIGVQSPRGIGGTTVTLHVEVADVDNAFSAAVTAGAESMAEPADQPHGARHGTLVDPYGHRWMLSQQVEQVSLADYDERLRVQGATVTGAGDNLALSDPDRRSGGIWAALNYADATAGIRFMVDVLGFEADLVIPGDEPGVVVHSQLRWPEGGVVQAGSANRGGNVFSERPTGSESLYVITSDPMQVYERCVAAGAEVVGAPASPDYDPDGLVFTIRDPEGNLWSFGTYAGES